MWQAWENFIKYKFVENYKLVLRGDLNQNGYLYGGNLLKWVDEYAWIAATIDYPNFNFVTIAMDNVVFKKSVREGSILRFDITKSRTGNTSVQYNVNVFQIVIGDTGEDPVFSTQITFVRINENGEKMSINPNE